MRKQFRPQVADDAQARVIQVIGAQESANSDNQEEDWENAGYRDDRAHRHSPRAVENHAEEFFSPDCDPCARAKTGYSPNDESQSYPMPIGMEQLQKQLQVSQHRQVEVWERDSGISLSKTLRREHREVHRRESSWRKGLWRKTRMAQSKAMDMRPFCQPHL